MDDGALLVIEEQELVKKTVKFIKTGENACEKCYFHDHGHCPWDCDDGYYVEYNPGYWYTGKPTEEGWYLCWVSFTKEIAPMVYKWKNGKFMLTDIWECDDDILMWQKIDPYKEGKTNE